MVSYSQNWFVPRLFFGDIVFHKLKCSRPSNVLAHWSALSLASYGEPEDKQAHRPQSQMLGTYWRFSIRVFLQFSVLSLIKAPAERTHFVFLLYFVLIFRYYISVCFVFLHWRFSVRGVLTVQCFEPHRGPSGTPPAFSEMRSCLMGGRVRSWAQPIGMQMVKIVLLFVLVSLLFCFQLYWLCPSQSFQIRLVF